MTPQEVIDRVLELDRTSCAAPWQPSTMFESGGSIARRAACGPKYLVGISGDNLTEREIQVVRDVLPKDAELIAYYRSAAVQCARALRVAMEALKQVGEIDEDCSCWVCKAQTDINNIFNGADAGNEGE